MEGLTTLLGNMGDVFEAITGYFTDILELFVTEPLLLLMLGFLFVGAVIGLVMRVIHRT